MANGWGRLLRFALIVGACGAGRPTQAQQANVGVPFNQLGSGFFEQTGVGFSFNGPNFFFQQNSFNLATPQFGGFNPGAGATFGFGVPVGNGQASFNFAFGQGSQTSMTSSAPSVTIGNGGFGTFSAGSWTPFVVGAIPVVGDAPGIGLPFGPAASPSLLAERLSRLPHEAPQASAVAQPAKNIDLSLDPFQQHLAAANSTDSGTAGLSVAHIKQLRSVEGQSKAHSSQVEIDRLVAKGEAALTAGKPQVARIYFEQAARRADGDFKAELQRRIAKLDNK